MKKRDIKFTYKLFAFLFVMFVCAGFISCENPIIEKWWQEREVQAEPEPDPEPELGYHVIIKQLPPEIRYIFIEVINTVVTQLPPTTILQNIEIIEIEYIIFAGGQTEYNTMSPGPGAATWLTQAQYDTNNAYISNMITTLLANPNYLLVIHGHANPVLPPGDPGFEAELADCRRIAQERADNVAAEFARRGILWIKDTNDPNFENNRIKTNGFGGNRTIADPSHPELNRRVEVIIVNISTEEVTTLPVPSP